MAAPIQILLLLLHLCFCRVQFMPKRVELAADIGAPLVGFLGLQVRWRDPTLCLCGAAHDVGLACSRRDPRRRRHALNDSSRNVSRLYLLLMALNNLPQMGKYFINLDLRILALGCIEALGLDGLAQRVDACYVLALLLVLH